MQLYTKRKIYGDGSESLVTQEDESEQSMRGTRTERVVVKLDTPEPTASKNRGSPSLRFQP